MVTVSPVEAAWLALEYEARMWDWAEHGSRPSRRVDRQFRQYLAAIPPSIASARAFLTPETTNLVAEAERRCAWLDRQSGGELTELAGFLLRSESVASSKIERVGAPAQAVFEVMAGVGRARGMAGQVAANIRAMQYAIEAAAPEMPLGTPQLLAIHRALLGDDTAERTWAGRLRAQQNWIGASDDCPRDALFVPPRPERVGPLLDDLFAFAKRADIAPVVQAAIVHAQFETIHPFTDGNGRVGRALIHIVLRRRAVVTRTLVPISTVLLSEPENYFEGLGRYREGALDGWVSDFARATVLAAQEGEILAARLADVRAGWLEAARPRKNSAGMALLAGLIQQPVITIDVATKTASTVRCFRSSRFT